MSINVALSALVALIAFFMLLLSSFVSAEFSTESVLQELQPQKGQSEVSRIPAESRDRDEPNKCVFPEVPGCSCYRLMFSCDYDFRSKNFNNRFDLLSPFIPILAVTSYNISQLNQDHLGHLVHLKVLFLIENQIKNVSDEAFSNNSRLKLLNLGRNLLNAVPKLARLEQLKILDLSHNLIQRINDQDFEMLSAIVTIDLTQNRINYISDGAFDRQKLSSLSILLLDYNKLQTISSAVIKSLNTIAFIDLRNNSWHCDCRLQSAIQLIQQQSEQSNNSSFTSALAPQCQQPNHLANKSWSSINSEELCQETSTESVSQSIVILPQRMSEPLPKATDQDEITCVFTRVPGCLCFRLFFSCSNRFGSKNYNDLLSPFILSLIVDKNNISQLSHNHLDHLVHLKVLALIDNQIKNVSDNAFSGNSRLEYLNLGRNLLEAVPNLAILKQLKVLDLSYNFIERISNQDFEMLSAIEIIDLTQNRISYISDGAFDNQNLPSLSILLLDDNKLQTISPAVFESLNQIAFVDLRNNSWHCDCRLSSAIQLVQQRSKQSNNGSFTSAPAPQCQQPNHLANNSWSNINTEELCSDEEQSAYEMAHHEHDGHSNSAVRAKFRLFGLPICDTIALVSLALVRQIHLIFL